MKNEIIFKNRQNRASIESPTRLLIVIVFSIIVSDVLVDIFIKLLPSMAIWSELLLDSFLLSIILFPFLYFFAFRPLTIAITERKREEEEAHKIEEKFRNALINSDDSINITRLSDGMFVTVNEGFTKVLGYTREEAIGKTSLELNIWADQENRKKLVQELQEKGRVDSFETIFLKKDGSTVNGLTSASLINLDGVTHILSVIKDITGRKRIEAELAREQFLINALMDNLPDHIYFKDRESRFIRINKAQANFLGLNDPDQAVGKTDFDFFTGEHANQAYQDEQNIIRTGQLLSTEEKETWEDRPATWVSTVKMPLYDNNGNIVGTFGISRDVTGRKKAEEELSAERNLLRTLIDNIPDRIYAKDAGSRFIISNDALMKRMDKSAQNELIGKSDFDLLPRELAAKFYADEQEIIRTGKPLINKEEFSGDISGSINWSLTTKVPLLDTSGNIIGIVGIGKDITERKRKEMESKVMYEIAQGITASGNLDELMRLIHKSLGKVVYAENCFVALHNQKTGLFSFPYFVDKFDPTPSPTSMGKSCTAYVFRTGKPFLFTEELFDHLKEQNEVELVGSFSPSWIGIPLQTPSRTIGVLVLQHYEKENVYLERDVKFLVSVGSQIAFSIERKLDEEEIKLKNELLQASNAEKDKFFSIIAHDLRGPLSAFVAVTQILTEDIQNMTLDEISDITLSMKIDALNIYSLLENLLEWSRLKRGVIEFNPEKLNLKNTINKGIDAVSASARKKKIAINVSVSDDLEIIADKHMFETVVRNLVSNGVKFTTAGGKVNVSADMGQDHNIEIKITDTGIGMTPELKSKMFLLNEKTNRKGTEGESSSGLGLLLCKEFIEKHGGRIWVESEVGKGSTFSFVLPEGQI
jgi:two-component system, sensor histidine kinase and response regulator